jgi:hypothetical protein
VRMRESSKDDSGRSKRFQGPGVCVCFIVWYSIVYSVVVWGSVGDCAINSRF